MQPSYRRLGRDKFKAMVVRETRPPLLPYQQVFTTRGDALRAAREYIGKKEKSREAAEVRRKRDQQGKAQSKDESRTD